MPNPYKADKTLLPGTTSCFNAWQTHSLLPVFNIILQENKNDVNGFCVKYDVF